MGSGSGGESIEKIKKTTEKAEERRIADERQTSRHDRILKRQKGDSRPEQ